MRSRAAASAALAVVAAGPAVAAGLPAAGVGTAAAAERSVPGAPPLAFRAASLVRAERLIDIEVITVAADVGVTVVVGRRGTRLGHTRWVLDRGTTHVPVRIGPRGLKPLRRGLHVDVRIYYGPQEPLRAHPALRLRRAMPAPPTAPTAARRA